VAEGLNDVRVEKELNDNQRDLILAEHQYYVRLETESNNNTVQEDSSVADGQTRSPIGERAS
jgi:hypothetical protein